MRFRVTYRDGKDPVEVSTGAFSQIAAKRRFGVDAIMGDNPDPEAALFAVFVEVVGPQAAAVTEAFDEWLYTVESFDPAEAPDDDTADPPPADPSGSSLDSPPT